MQNNTKGFLWLIIWIVIATIVMLYLIFVFIFSIKVPVWYMAIKVNMYWDSKWVSVYTLKTGRNYYNPFLSDVYKYPTHIQQKEYRNINFQDTDWLVIWTNIWLDYQFNEAQVPKIFEQYRANSSKITDELMFTWLKNSINRAASKFKVDEIYWPKKEEFRLLVLENIKQDFDTKWIVVNNIYLVGDMKLPEQVITRINAKIEATQTAMQKENELRAVEAEAAKVVAQAKWEAEAKVTAAKWNAEALEINAKAEAEAIKIKSQAIMNQGWAEYVQLQAIEQWNWVLPVTTLWDNVPFVNLK